MKFRRINDTTIRCIVSREDMQEYGIALEDFFKNKGKVHDFLHVVVEKAEEEVGYEPRDGMLSMQIMPIGPNSISITFTEGDENERADMLMQSIKDTIRGMIEADSNQEYLEYTGLDDEEGVYEEEEYLDEEDGLLPFHEGNKEEAFPTYQKMIIFMKNLEELSAYCKAAAIDKTVKSDLYYLESRNVYGMIVEKGRLSNTIFRHIIMLAAEFDCDISDSEYLMSYVREHGELLVEKKAYRILRKNY